MVLGRRWCEGSLVAFVLLNPSTADEEGDDPTIRRCIGFAQRHGFGGLEAVNLYAYRATNRCAGRWLPGGTNKPDATAALGYRMGSKAEGADLRVWTANWNCRPTPVTRPVQDRTLAEAKPDIHRSIATSTALRMASAANSHACGKHSARGNIRFIKPLPVSG